MRTCLCLFCSNSALKSHFSEIQLLCDRETDRPTDQWTDGPTEHQSHKVLKKKLSVRCEPISYLKGDSRD